MLGEIDLETDEDGDLDALTDAEGEKLELGERLTLSEADGEMEADSEDAVYVTKMLSFLNPPMSVPTNVPAGDS